MSRPDQKTSLLIILLAFAGGIWLPVMPHLMEANIDRFGPGAIDRFNEVEVGFRVLTYFCYFMGLQMILLAGGMLWHRYRELPATPPAETRTATPDSN
jgi:hypothetical protein